MENPFTRLEWLIGQDGLERLQKSSVALFGCGGVGSYTMEALVRSGIGRLVIIDGDEVTISNINRQLIALPRHVGRRKVDVAKERCLSIRPDMEVIAQDLFYTESKYPQFVESLRVDMVVDAIDMVAAKLDIIESCRNLAIPCISAMGTGNKLDPTKLVMTDISKTSICPLARVMRRELKKKGILSHPVVYSTEVPLVPNREDDSKSPGSCGFVPSVAGLFLASYVIRQLLQR